MEAAEADVVRRALAKDPRHRTRPASTLEGVQQALDRSDGTEVGPGQYLPAVVVRRGPPSPETVGRAFPGAAEPVGRVAGVEAARRPRCPPPIPGWKLIALVLTAVLGAGGLVAWQVLGPDRQTVTERRTGGGGGPGIATASPVPNGFVAVQGAPEENLPDGRRAPKQIVRTLKGESVVFQLVSPADPSIPPFYMMRDKVWERLLRAYLAGGGVLLGPEEWKSVGSSSLIHFILMTGGDWSELLPAYWVSVDDAQAICEWVGGLGARVPSVREWDAAGGRFGQPGPARAYRGADKEYQVGEFALQAPGVSLAGPLPVGFAGRDVSLFGCRDMGANGYEWTRTVADTQGKKSVSFESKTNETIVLRGQVYSARFPFEFTDNEDQPRQRYDDDGKPISEAYVTFRAVVPIPPAR